MSRKSRRKPTAAERRLQKEVKELKQALMQIERPLTYPWLDGKAVLTLTLNDYAQGIVRGVSFYNSNNFIARPTGGNQITLYAVEKPRV